MVYYDYNYSAPAASVFNGVGTFLLAFFLLFFLVLFAWLVVCYVFYSVSVYKIARRRGIHHPWAAWLPVGNVWVLGSISDQYQYLVKRRVCNRRKVLTGLSIGLYAALIPAVIGYVSALSNLISGEAINSSHMSAILAIVAFACLVTLVLAVLMLVFEYIALYDLFRSCEPGNAVLYLVLSIVLGVVLPFFLFACRNKDLGMPPRKTVQPAAPAEQYTPAGQEPFAQNTEELQ